MPAAPSGFVLVEYLGENFAKFPEYGPATGRQYKFSRSGPPTAVHQADVPELTGMAEAGRPKYRVAAVAQAVYIAPDPGPADEGVPLELTGPAPRYQTPAAVAQPAQFAQPAAIRQAFGQSTATLTAGTSGRGPTPGIAPEGFGMFTPPDEFDIPDPVGAPADDELDDDERMAVLGMIEQEERAQRAKAPQPAPQPVPAPAPTPPPAPPAPAPKTPKKAAKKAASKTSKSKPKAKSKG